MQWFFAKQTKYDVNPNVFMGEVMFSDKGGYGLKHNLSAMYCKYREYLTEELAEMREEIRAMQHVTKAYKTITLGNVMYESYCCNSAEELLDFLRGCEEVEVIDIKQRNDRLGYVMRAYIKK